jgi:hypothetical protein
MSASPGPSCRAQLPPPRANNLWDMPEASSDSVPARLAAIREQLKLLSDYL